MHGLHLTADLRGCAPGTAAMTDAATLRQRCLQAVAAAGLSAVDTLFHTFPAAGGVTGVVLLAESHVAVHTWPEFGTVTLDVFVCNLRGDNGPRAQALLQALTAAFAPAEVQVQRLERGRIAAAAAP